MTDPLPLPENFNPETFLLSQTTENGVFHETRRGASLAEQLVANGTSEDLTLAEKVLDATLRCQELRPEDPHYGNFYWMAEDDTVADLNAVEFNLERLIPMMLNHADRLPEALQQRVLQAVRLGLAEIQRLDVHVAYSNIAMLDIFNSSLGGELLNDEAIAQRGYDKMAAWLAFTDESGIPREYNSPTYTPVIIRALIRLIALTRHHPTKVRAKTMLARLALSAGLHIHRATGRWAGPHSRAYQPSIVCERPAEIEMFNDWLANGELPAWTRDLLSVPADPFQVVETASAYPEPLGNLGLTTYHSTSFALGTATKEYSGQSDVLMAHYVREGAERPGVMYTRYVMDEKWMGDFYHATDRTKSRNLIEEGRFFGVQQGARSIGLYAPQNMTHCHSAKATFIFTRSDDIDEIWVDGERIESLPVDVPQDSVIVIGSGDALFALRPLSRRDAGRNAPLRLVEKAGDLVLEIYNYLGEAKGFWEMGPQGPFFQGHAHCGVYLEAAERSAYADGRAFGELVAGGTLSDEAAPQFTIDGVSERPWTVSYSRDGETLGIEIDLMAWKLKRRWTEAGELGWPMLQAPNAAQNRDGKVEAGGATLTCGPAAGWVYANPEANRWVAGYHGQSPAPLRLDVPGGSVVLDGMSTGTIVWDNGNVSIEAVEITGTPQITGGQIV